MIGERVYELLEQQPMTVEELSHAMGLPEPHIRAAVSDLAFMDRRVMCDKDGKFFPGTPPDDWPKVKRR